MDTLTTKQLSVRGDSASVGHQTRERDLATPQSLLKVLTGSSPPSRGGVGSLPLQRSEMCPWGGHVWVSTGMFPVDSETLGLPGVIQETPVPDDSMLGLPGQERTHVGAGCSLKRPLYPLRDEAWEGEGGLQGDGSSGIVSGL